MKRAALLAAAAWLACAAGAMAVDPRARSDSGQFTVYCEDANLRRQVTSFAATTKEHVLTMLGESDTWRQPIVITIQDATSPNQPIANLRMVQSDAGMKIAIDVHLRTEPSDVNLQRYVVRAVMLEYMYRRTGITAGAYAEPPWWLVEGTVELIRRRENGMDSDLFRKLVETNKLPPIADFLAQKPDELGPTALAMDRALSLCLLQLLLDQPSGRSHVAAFLRTWRDAGGDSIAALAKEFPALAGGQAAIQKWWVLNLARFAAADRYQALSAEETDRKIAELLEFDIREEKSGETRHFKIAEFPQFVKLRESRGVLAMQRAGLVALSTRANPLLRPVVAEYEEALALLERGKSRGLRERLERADRLRVAIVQRVGEIADFLNWFEATQLGGRSKAFDSYLKTANELSEQDKQHRDPIGRYLDDLEKQY